MLDSRKPWYQADAYDDEAILNRTLGCFRMTSGWRSLRIEDISAMAWAYERDRWISTHGTGIDRLPENVKVSMDWLADGTIPPSVNINKNSVDTVVNWLMVENPAIEVKTLGANYEQRRQTEMRSHALDALFNLPEYAQQHRIVGRDGLSKGWGACTPRVRNGRVIFQRLHYAQVYWDPYDARDGKPTMVGVVEYVDRDHIAAWYKKLKGVPDHKARMAALDKCRSQVWGRNPITGVDGYQWIGPYDMELQAYDVTEGTDRVCLVHWWRTASAPEAKDGRYTLMCIGGDTGVNYGGRLLVDHEFSRCTLPVVWWTPYPADEGIDGIGLQHLLKPWQEAIDRSFYKLQRVLDKYGHIKAFFPPGTVKNKEEFLAAGVTVIETDSLAEPHFEHPIDLSPADLEWVDRCLSWSRNEYGINQMLASGGTALGANAPAVAMVEEQYRSLDRLSDIESNWQNFRMALARETLHAIDDAVKLDPSFAAHFFDQNNDMQVRKWSELIRANERYTCTVEPVGALGKTRAGRISKIMDLAQRGMVDPQLAKDALLSSPDIRRMARLETAAMRLVEYQLAEIIDPDGDHANSMPSEGDPTALQLDMADRYIFDARASGAEPDTIERLREYRRTAEAVSQAITAKQAPPPGAAQGLPPAPGGAPEGMAGPANLVDMSSQPV